MELPEPARSGFRGEVPWLLSSVSLHVLVMLLLAYLNARKTLAPVPVAALHPEASARVYMPSAETLRRLAPPSERKKMQEPATPAPPPPKTAKDRISIGAPDPRHARELILKRDQDISSVPSAPGSVASHVATPPPGSEEKKQAAQTLPLPMGHGSIAAGDSAAQPSSERRPSLLASIEGIERRMEKSQGADGVMTGAVGQQVGALFFDPQGADFTAWINQFTHEVYRNWIVPQAVLLGFRGEVDIEFTVARNGTMHDVHVTASSGTAALDHAATNALLGSRLLPLPNDYGPPEVTMKVSFHYNEGPRRS